MPKNKTVKMLVGLKIPDTTAHSALQALHEMGYKGILALHRFIYYEFTVLEDDEKFKKQITTVDIIVNANKSTADFSLPKDGHLVLVANKDKNSGLKGALRQLGIAVESAKKGVLWQIALGSAITKPGEYVRKAAEDLLCSKHFENYKVLR